MHHVNKHFQKVVSRVSLSRVLREAEGPCLRDLEILFQGRNIWPVFYEMSKTFIVLRRKKFSSTLLSFSG